MTTTTKSFHAGDQVRDNTGRVLTVIAQNGCQVFTSDNGWSHPTKLHLITPR